MLYVVAELVTGGLVGINHLAPHRVKPEQRAGVLHHQAVEQDFAVGAAAFGDIAEVEDQPDPLATGLNRGDGAFNQPAVLHLDLVEDLAVQRDPELAGAVDELLPVLDQRGVQRHQCDLLARRHQGIGCLAPYLGELRVDVLGAAGKVDGQHTVVYGIEGVGQEGVRGIQLLDVFFLSLAGGGQCRLGR